MTAPDKKWPKHRRSGKPLLREVYADPGQNGFYYREKHFDSVMRYIAEPDVNALVAAAWQDGCDQGRSLEKGHMGVSGPPVDAQAALDAIKAQVRREARKVKPLAWERLKGIQTDFKAKCILGTYLVECFDDGDGDYYVWALEWGKIEGPKMESAEAAKAAAQADYERRILSALMDTQTEGEG